MNFAYVVMTVPQLQQQVKFQAETQEVRDLLERLYGFGETYGAVLSIGWHTSMFQGVDIWNNDDIGEALNDLEEQLG